MTTKNAAMFARAGLAFAGSGNIIKSNVVSGLDSVAQKVLKDSKGLAPVLTGALRASGRVRRINQYRRAIEFGGRGSGVDYALAVEFGTFRTAPRFFLRRALLKNKVSIKKALGRKVDRTLSTLARMGSNVR